MITNYYTLRALVHAWEADLVGCRVGDAFSQARGELTLALARPGGEWMLRASVRAPDHYLFRIEGYSRKRRNVATLFEDALDAEVAAVRLAERDRLLTLDLADGRALLFLLFGPRANVLLLDADRTILEAFQRDDELAGTAAPEPRAAPEVASLADFEARWKPGRKTTDRAVASAFPLLDRTLGAEIAHRAEVTAETPEAVTEAERARLYAEGREVLAALEQPAPCVYWRGELAEAFSLIPLATHAHLREERFDDVDAAVRVYTRRMLGQRRFRELHDPVAGALAKAAVHYRRSAERMLEELTNESRAERYETWGHLLMATPDRVPARADEVTLPDLFAGGDPVAIPLDPAQTAVENAQRYYAKARQTRQARAHAEARLEEMEARADEAEALRAELEEQTTVRDVEKFLKQEADRLAPFTGQQGEVEGGVPFRRFRLPEGYEVWVGKNARQNDELTFHYAQKYDLWMHARGVPGSHAVLRLPGRDARPGPHIKERAASIAAYYSKAQGSALVPVMITPRKYVRKPKGAAPGAVRVDREEVVIVPPRLPK